MEDLCVRFSFVFKRLLFHLDDQHLVMLKEANRQVSNHIDNERYYWIRIIQKLFEKHNGCTEEIPESWKKVILKVLGNPADLKNHPCDIEYKHEVYVNEEISWVFWKRQSYRYKVL